LAVTFQTSDGATCSAEALHRYDRFGWKHTTDERHQFGAIHTFAGRASAPMQSVCVHDVKWRLHRERGATPVDGGR
jgi:hypothetical protein